MGGQSLRKPREGKADRDEGNVGGPGREQKRCPDILGRGGEGTSWKHDVCLRD
jgi:hypothetical protein